MRSLAHQRGFTLIELMITVAVLVVLLTVAIPNFRTLIARNELVTLTNQWVGAINAARAESVKLNQPVVVCGEDDVPTSGVGTTCSAALAGQVRFMPRNGGNEAILHPALADSVTPPLQVISSTTVRFRGNGIGYRGDSMGAPYNTASGDPAVVVLCSTALAAENERHIELVSGTTVQVATATNADCQ